MAPGKQLLQSYAQQNAEELAGLLTSANTAVQLLAHCCVLVEALAMKEPLGYLVRLTLCAHGR